MTIDVDLNAAVRTPRSLLFVPGARPERFAKARASGADLVCIDLEDAVAPQDKSQARADTLEFIQQAPGGDLGLRINGLTTAFGIADLNALISTQLIPAFVMLPKADSAEMVAWAAELLHSSIAIVPIIETARALDAASAIFAHPRVHCAIFGAVDYSADVGCTLDFPSLLVPRTRLINAAAQHDVTLLDVPYVDVKDTDGLAAEIAQTKALGLRARSAIHPAQIPVIHKALAPSAEELAYAQRVVEAFEAAEGRVALLDGKLLELPVIKAARRTLALAQTD